MDISQIKEHMEVVGSDGGHVGTVDRVEGDSLKLTRNDSNADGKHHLLLKTLVASVNDRVILSISASDALRYWQTVD